MDHRPPLSLKNSPALQQVLVTWADNTSQTLSHQRLRGACPCAKCRAGRISGRISLVESDVQLTAINPMGYGLQMVFSDGHDRGIYPWSYLHELGCP